MSVAAVDARRARLSRAQAVLSQAEAKTAASSPRSPFGGASLNAQDSTASRFPVPGPLAPAFPSGGLRPGSSVRVGGAARSSLTLALAGSAMGEESWCALVGMRDVGVGALRGLGVDPARTALVPELGANMPQSLATLVDGLDVLVLGADLTLTPALWRSLTSRARTQETLLLRVEEDGPHTSDLAVTSEHRAWGGLTRGSGRLRTRTIHVHCRGRGVSPSARGIDIALPTISGSIAAVPSSAMHPSQLPQSSRSLTASATAAQPPRLSLVRKAG